MEEMHRVCARDSVALTLAVSRYNVRRDLWVGDRIIDLDAEKFGRGVRDRFFVLIKSFPVIPADIQEFRHEAVQVQKLYGVKTYLALVEHGGAHMLVDARLKQRMVIDENRFNVRSFGSPEPSLDFDSQI